MAADQRGRGCTMNRGAWFIAACLAALLTHAAFAATSPGVGDAPVAIDRFGEDQNDVPIRLDALHGQVVVLTFWASWCGPCLEEMTTLSKLAKIPAVQGRLSVVAMNFHEDRSRYWRINRALASLPIHLGWASTSLSRQYGVKALPNMFIIGKDGRIAAHHVGYSSDGIDAFVDEINQLLNAPDPADAATAGT
ncbi:TlpA disulfide reductase family protein [Solimonas marina]|uniref:TlpA family protein disulfide reductase n=1 Tax=Solimonas marina TaxID=2714601 RepID=A0A970B8A8_9GAMM|nr:TlpA disulfide reductase family protein [Solimonas marina]NKF22089.1 TlpA family protein disulfide reductase [Solimonas marina]